MNTKLNYSLDWEQMAKEANWSAAALATLCGVSKDTLRRYFQKNKGANPK
jgi:transcriptional regulator GlxA family with amidase domain